MSGRTQHAKVEQYAIIETSALRSNKLLLFVCGLFIFSMLGILSTVLVVRLFHYSILLIILSILLFFVFPLIFANKKIKQLSKPGILKFSADFISLDTHSRKTFLLKEEFKCRYSDIRGYRMIESEENDFSYLKLVLKNGGKIKYLFFKKPKDEAESVTGDDIVIKNVLKFFHLYNEGKNLDKKISLLPNFYATKAGKVSIFSLAILIGGSIIFQIVYKPDTIPFSLFLSIIFYFRIKSQQERDIDLYKKYKDK